MGRECFPQMRYSRDIDFFRAILIGLVILVHIVNFGNIYPSVKSAILSFIMPTFLVITGYLVNVNKSIQDYALYILKIWLPYMILVIGYAVLSLYLPVRDGIKVFDIPTILDVLFIKSIGPYWFLHAMIVCGIIYYFAFHISYKLDITAKYSTFASLLIIVSLTTPFLSIKTAIYYFIGVGIRQYYKDLVHPTFRVIRQSCSAYSLSLKYRSSLNPYALRFITFILLLIPSTLPVEIWQSYHASIPLL